jgi:hypothetical protein
LISWIEDCNRQLYFQPENMGKMLELMKSMQEETRTNQAKTDAHREADREHMKQMMAKIETDREEIVARMVANQEKMNASLGEEIQSGQAEIRSLVNAWIADMWDDRKETVSCQITTEACLENKELNAEDMEFELEHWEVPIYGRGRSEIVGNNEEAAQGPASSCRAPREAKGTDPRRLWNPEDVGCRLQKGVPSCRSGTAQEKRLQENSDPGKLWTAEGIGRNRQEDDPQHKSGTAQGTRMQEIQPGQCGARIPKRTDVREETLEGPGMQQWRKDRGLKQQLRGSKRIKDLGLRWPLCLRNSRF